MADRYLPCESIGRDGVAGASEVLDGRQVLVQHNLRGGRGIIVVEGSDVNLPQPTILRLRATLTKLSVILYQG